LGASTNSYVLSALESTKYVRVQVINTTANGAGIAYSASSSKVGSPYNTVAPQITGTLRVGNVQTVSTGTWSNPPTSYSYLWQQSFDGVAWSDISGATSSTFIPTFDLANLQIRVIVSVTNAIGTTTVSSSTIQNLLPPQATVIPTISGTSAVGQTLLSSTGTWPSTLSGYVYQWQRSSDGGATWVNISGAIGSTYVLVAADAGYRIRLQVSLTTNAGTSAAYSLPSTNVLSI